MKTLIELPRPLLLRAASRAARKRMPLSRYIAESLEKELSREPSKPTAGPAPDPLFEDLRQELGL